MKTAFGAASRRGSMKARLFMASFVFISAASLARADDQKLSSDRDTRLEYFAGAWDVTALYRLPDATETKGKAKLTSNLVLSGRFLQQQYEGQNTVRPWILMLLLGFDNAKDKFVEFHVHASVPGLFTITTEGNFSEDGKVLTLESVMPVNRVSMPGKLRAVTTVVDKDHYTLELLGTDMNGKEGRTVLLTHTRKK